jgi:hypothetical protein
LNFIKSCVFHANTNLVEGWGPWIVFHFQSWVWISNDYLSIIRNFNLERHSFCTECSTMLSIIETCNSYSKTNLTRRFNALHNGPTSELSLHFIGLLPIITVFYWGKFSFWLQMLHYVQFHGNMEIPLQNQLGWKVECSTQYSTLWNESAFHRTVPIYYHCYSGETLILTHNDLLCWIS